MIGIISDLNKLCYELWNLRDYKETKKKDGLPFAVYQSNAAVISSIDM